VYLEIIGVFGDYPPVLQDLNFVRDAYKTSVPHPILFFLPDYAITRLAKFAPDFWAWRSAVFRFHTDRATLEIFTDLKDYQHQASSYHNLGSVAQHIGNFEEAQYYYQQALDVKNAYGTPYSSIPTYHNLGVVAQELANLKKHGTIINKLWKWV
jgi:tetratricopeptide (TPR) repeat protein